MSTSVENVLTILRKRHLIGDPIRLQNYLVYDPFGSAPLQGSAVLYQLGVRDLSTLQLRTRMPGGSSLLQGNSLLVFQGQIDILHVLRSKCNAQRYPYIFLAQGTHCRPKWCNFRPT